MILSHAILTAPPAHNYEELLNNFLTEKKAREERLYKETQLNAFLSDLGYTESSNNPYAYNTLGYIGEWQFGEAALIDAGYSHVCRERFISDPTTEFSRTDQRDAMLRLMDNNYAALADLIEQYEGTAPHGVTITKSGVLAAAHLAGAHGVRQYILTGTDRRDAYGTRLTDYLYRFAGYEF